MVWYTTFAPAKRYRHALFAPALPDSLIHVVDDEDGAPLFPGDLNKGAELPPYLVGGVDPCFLPDVGGEGVKDNEPCARLSSF